MRYNSLFMLSWYKARYNVFRLQRRIFKSVYLGDIFYALKLQKLLIASNSSRLISIRFVTQMENYISKNQSSNDHKSYLNFTDKFNLSNYLLENFNNWNPSKYKEVTISKDNLDSFLTCGSWSFADRCWHSLVKLAVEPAHQAIFSPRNFSLYDVSSLCQVQKMIFLNLGKESYGLQKRILLIKLSEEPIIFDNVLFLKRIIAPRSIKLGLFRFFKLGLSISLDEDLRDVNFFEYFLSNLLLNDIDFSFNCLRYSSNLLVFMKPNDNEALFYKKIRESFYLAGINEV